MTAGCVSDAYFDSIDVMPSLTYLFFHVQILSVLIDTAATGLLAYRAYKIRSRVAGGVKSESKLPCFTPLSKSTH
jgi:hypothetical protein